MKMARAPGFYYITPYRSIGIIPVLVGLPCKDKHRSASLSEMSWEMAGYLFDNDLISKFSIFIQSINILDKP